MSYLRNCPVCGEQVEIPMSSPLKIVERRYHHRDHYFFWKLPAYEHLPDTEDGTSRTLITDPYGISAQTLIALKNHFGDDFLINSEADHTAFEKNDIEEIYNLLYEYTDKRDLFLTHLADSIKKLPSTKKKSSLLQEILYDAGYKYKRGRLIPAIPDSRGLTEEPRERDIFEFRKRLRTLEKVGFNWLMKCLALKTSKGLVALHIDFISTIGITPDSIMNIDDPNSPFIIISRNLGKKTPIDIEHMIRSGKIEIGDLLIEVERLKVSPLAHSDCDIPLRFNIIGNVFGLGFSTYDSIHSLLQFHGINHRDSFTIGNERFTSFKEFTMTTIGHELDVSWNVRIQIIAAYAASISKVEVKEKLNISIVLVEGLEDDYKVRVTYRNRNGIQESMFVELEEVHKKDGLITYHGQVLKLEWADIVHVFLEHSKLGVIEKQIEYIGRVDQSQEIESIIEMSSKNENRPSASDILEKLFPKYYENHDLEIDESERSISKSYNDKALQERFARILMQSDIIPTSEKAKFEQYAKEAHSGYEISDFSFSVKYNDNNFSVHFVIKSGQETKGKSNEEKVWYQITRPIENEFDFSIFIASDGITAPLKNRLNKYNKTQCNFCLDYIIDTQLARLLKSYDELN